MGTLPILSAFLDYPTVEPSPYSPASRLFWNEFFIDVSTIPEFQNSPAAQKIAGSAAFNSRLEKFKASEYVNYREEWAARRKILGLGHRPHGHLDVTFRPTNDGAISGAFAEQGLRHG